jgi:cysteine desulfurase
MGIYLDNASATPIHPEVFSAMTPYLQEHFGNAAANNAYGRKAKEAIEDSRGTIARLLKVSADEIIFTTSGTEANNMALVTAIAGHGIDHVITSPFEHSGVLQTLGALQKKYNTRISFLRHYRYGRLDLSHLEYLLRTNTRNLISVMHANNLTGLVNPIADIAELGKRYGACFHSDTIQTIGKYALNLQKTNLDFASASAHKFHGPMGAGFLFNRKGRRVTQIIYGGSQEKQVRAGTENVAGIVGLAKALETAYWDIEDTNTYLKGLKHRMIAKLQEQVPGVRINNSVSEESLPTILSVSFPYMGQKSLSGYLDDIGVAISGSSGYPTQQSTAVFKALGISQEMETVRFSFSKKNTPDEIDTVVENLVLLYQGVAA